jgi:hypothetical protein
MEKQKPLCKFRAGQISSAVWENSINVNGRTVTVMKATVQSRYRDNQTGTWKTSGSYGKNEIPRLIYVLQKAYDTMMTEENTKTEDNSGDEEFVE